jgi:hypothetical protein
MKKVAMVAVIAFAVTLAVIIGKRMSTDAMAVVIGVGCGVLASIPTSLLILAVSNRQGRHEVRQRRDYPPVVIVNPGNNQPGYLQRFDGLTTRPPLPTQLMQGQERQFRVIGDEDTLGPLSSGQRTEGCSVQDRVVLDQERYF